MNYDLKNPNLFMSNVELFVETNDVISWFVDSGALIHMTCNKDWYENFKEVSNGGNIYLGDDHAHQIKRYGDIPVTLPNGTIKWIDIVIYVPEINKNMIYVSKITNNNLNVEFLKTHCIVKELLDHYKVVASGVRVGELYKLDVTNKNHQALTSTILSIERLWHHTYGHINYHDLLWLEKQTMVEGIPMLKNEYATCEGCALGKMDIDKFPSNFDRRRRDVL